MFGFVSLVWSLTFALSAVPAGRLHSFPCISLHFAASLCWVPSKTWQDTFRRAIYRVSFVCLWLRFLLPHAHKRFKYEFFILELILQLFKPTNGPLARCFWYRSDLVRSLSSAVWFSAAVAHPRLLCRPRYQITRRLFDSHQKVCLPLLLPRLCLFSLGVLTYVSRPPFPTSQQTVPTAASNINTLTCPLPVLGQFCLHFPTFSFPPSLSTKTHIDPPPKRRNPSPCRPSFNGSHNNCPKSALRTVYVQVATSATS